MIEALDAGLAVYEGKALVNSMTGEDDRMDAILPLVKKYDAAILALPNDETGIPMTADERMPIVEKIVRRVEKEGISLENLLIDPLAMPVGAEPEAVKQTLETINRHALNASFMPMAMSMGLTSAIMDARTPEVVQSVRAADLLLALDAWGSNWITNFREAKA